MASTERVTQAFWLALCRHDLARASALLAEDAEFRGVGGAPLATSDALRSVAGDLAGEPYTHLKTLAVYDGMLIAERAAARDVGEAHTLLSLVHVRGDRITSWQDFQGVPTEATSLGSRRAS